MNTAKGSLTTAQGAKGAKPTDSSVTTAKTAVSTAGGELSRAQGDLSGLDGRASHILDEFDTLRGQARSAVSKAAGHAPAGQLELVLEHVQRGRQLRQGRGQVHR